MTDEAIHKNKDRVLGIVDLKTMLLVAPFESVDGSQMKPLVGLNKAEMFMLQMEVLGELYAFVGRACFISSLW